MLPLFQARDHMKIGPLFQQPTREFFYAVGEKEIYLPGTLFEFPFMVETLPIWTFFGTFGRVLAHELTHGVVYAARAQGAWKGPTHWYNTEYKVRMIASTDGGSSIETYSEVDIEMSVEQL